MIMQGENNLEQHNINKLFFILQLRQRKKTTKKIHLIYICNYQFQSNTASLFFWVKGESMNDPWIWSGSTKIHTKLQKKKKKKYIRDQVTDVSKGVQTSKMQKWERALHLMQTAEWPFQLVIQKFQEPQLPIKSSHRKCSG